MLLLNRTNRTEAVFQNTSKMYQFQFLAAIILCVVALTTGTTGTTDTEAPRDDAVVLLVSTIAGLVAVSLDTLNTTVISPQITHAVAFDKKTGKVIWSEYDLIRRAHPNDTEPEVLKTGTGYVFSIAIDTLTGNVYYGDFSGSRILLCNSEVQNCVVLATSPVVDDPIGIAIHLQQRKIYWTNRGTLKNIVKANMDGTNATQIVAGLNEPAAIVVDNDEGRIYWTETLGNTIGTSDLEGRDRHILMALSDDPRPFGLAMRRNLLYIGNWAGSHVQSVDKYTGQNLSTVYPANTLVRHVAIIDRTV